jgi:16S rRNA (cytosine1402-N4)-methyltransferase
LKARLKRLQKAFMNEKHEKQHQPVLLQEAIELLDVKPDHWYIDGTFGRGGHTSQILQRGGQVIAIDQDEMAIEYGQQKFSKEIAEGKLILVRENFDKLDQIIRDLKSKHPDLQISGVLFDFGTSVDQLKDPNRGFSFETEAELDMRMDQRLGVKAKDLLALLDEKQLGDMFFEFGGEEDSRKIAKQIVKIRKSFQITTTRDLTQIVEQIKTRRHSHLNPATKVFQALRIAVNSELDHINDALPKALEILEVGGKLVTISFHEGEDRIAKTSFKKWQEHTSGEILTPKALQPSEDELTENPRARSARLRAFKKN